MLVSATLCDFDVRKCADLCGPAKLVLQCAHGSVFLRGVVFVTATQSAVLQSL